MRKITRFYDVYWEGPFEWDQNESFKENIHDYHVLYQIYGSHHLYGRDVLLYLGSTNRKLTKRFREHSNWIEEEYDKVTIRLGSIGEFTNWKAWYDGDNYQKADNEIVEAIESLLIIAHQPAYNSRNKASANKAKSLRIFNTGHLGQLLPEVSSLYFLGE